MSRAVPAKAQWTEEEVATARAWGETIRQRRKTVGLSAQTLAARIKVHRNTLQRWESGAWVPNILEAARIDRELEKTAKRRAEFTKKREEFGCR